MLRAASSPNKLTDTTAHHRPQAGLRAFAERKRGKDRG
jgi:hypothetical protein